jgi:hypothetical protein
VTRHDEALEQMRSANPLPGIDFVDADELVLSRSHFKERRLAMTTRTPTPRDLTPTKSDRSWRSAIVATSAFILVIALLGVGTFVLRGSEGSMISPAEPATTVATTIPPVTTVPEESVAGIPEVPVIESGVRVLSEVPEYGANLVLGADGFPMLLSTTRTGDEYPGTARLFRCADIACDEFAIDVLEYEPEEGMFAVLGSAVTDAFVVAPTGDVYVAFESGIPERNGIPFVPREVVRWSDGVIDPLPVLSNWPGNEDTRYTPLPAAFDGSGNPIFVTYDGMHPAILNLLACSDPLCADYVEVELDSGMIHNQFPSVFFDGDEVRVVYGIGEPTGPPSPEAGYDGAEAVFQTKVATISDLPGSPQVSTEVIHEGLNAYMIDAAVNDGSDPVAWIWRRQETAVPGEPSQSIITVVCEDPSCNEAMVTENDAVDPGMIGEFDPQMRPISAYTETVYDPHEYASFLEEEQRIADEGLEDVGVMEPEPIGSNVVVAQCLDTACSSVERTTIATGEASWWYLDSLELGVTPDGTVLVAIAGSDESSEPGLRLFVYPTGDIGSGVEPIVGHAVQEWSAR